MHPLHTAEFLEHFKDHKDVDLRRTGRSTAQGLEIIARAIKRPHTQIVIVDHHGTLAADVNLANMVRVMVQRLDLKYLRFGKLDSGRPYVVFGDANEHSQD
jgi:hypothetical protein